MGYLVVCSTVPVSLRARRVPGALMKSSSALPPGFARRPHGTPAIRTPSDGICFSMSKLGVLGVPTAFDGVPTALLRRWYVLHFIERRESTARRPLWFDGFKTRSLTYFLKIVFTFSFCCLVDFGILTSHQLLHKQMIMLITL